MYLSTGFLSVNTTFTSVAPNAALFKSSNVISPISIISSPQLSYQAHE